MQITQISPYLSIIFKGKYNNNIFQVKCKGCPFRVVSILGCITSRLCLFQVMTLLGYVSSRLCPSRLCPSIGCDPVQVVPQYRLCPSIGCVTSSRLCPSRSVLKRFYMYTMTFNPIYPGNKDLHYSPSFQNCAFPPSLLLNK